ncbi:membrane protein [Advenella faeciporci]|uniref:Membrane protein n=1 Tax=Advenella faeciporci TaxID=797535 RepID=A0A918MZL6_9BURK|nr:YeeE/YedE family protein [Advenella faeciporci]GGW90287.1 membrane protein [Advenella faeciporci]
MKRITEYLVGLLFGMGLIISGMANPEKVLGFLDITGTWDPSLAFVMGGGILVGLFAFTAAKKRQTACLGDPMSLPSSTSITPRLLIGSLLFGIGWGLAGICPGPALVSMAAGEWKALLFVIAMVAGMAVFTAYENRKTPKTP